MLHGAVVPNDEVAISPFVLVDQIGIVEDCEHFIQESGAFVGIDPIEAESVHFAEIDEAGTSIGMFPNRWVPCDGAASKFGAQTAGRAIRISQMEERPVDDLETIKSVGERLRKSLVPRHTIDEQGWCGLCSDILAV